MQVDAATLALTRFANSFIHQNVADDDHTVRLRLHVDGRTAAGIDHRDRRRRPARAGRADLAAARLCAARPGLARPRAGRAGRRPAGAVDEATAARRRRTTGPQRVRAFVDAAGGLETAGYCRTRTGRGAFANSAGQSVAGAATEAAMDGIARDRGVGRRGPAGRDAPGRHRRCRARRAGRGQGAGRRRIRSSCRRAGTRWSSSRPRSRTCCSNLAMLRLQRQGGQRAAVVPGARRGAVRPGDDARRRPASAGSSGCRSTSEGTPTAAARPGRRGRDAARSRTTGAPRRSPAPRPPGTRCRRGGLGRGRRRNLRLLAAGDGRPGGRGRRPGRRLGGGGAGRRGRPRAAGDRPLVHPGARPAHAGR